MDLIRPIAIAFVIALLSVAGGVPALSAEGQDQPRESDPTGIEFFEKRIRPILAQRCYECHSAGAKEVKGGLLLDTQAGTRAGGESGHAVVPGSVADSLLISAIKYESYEMPPDGKLPDEVIADFAKWIEMGAPDPRDGRPDLAKTQKAPAISADLWSLQPIRRPDLPTVRDAAWPWTDLDRFIAAQRETRGLQPVRDSEPLALLRRVYFHLVGLPPSPEEIDAFAADYSRAAFERVVDKLLASPQFGERWGRHWLDVARFAESNGKDRDVLFPHAWRYRNYVIAALNDDKPYDQFIREQIAGDLLPPKDRDQRDERLIATGFLAIGPKSLMGGMPQRLMDLADDQIDVVGRAILGLTTSCARCHDHKFDPIPTKDYYALAGIFKSTETLYGGDTRNAGPGKGSEGFLQPLGEAADASAEERAESAKKLTALQKQLAEARETLKTRQQANAKIRATGEVPSREQLVARKQADEEVKRLTAEVDALQGSNAGPVEYCMAVREGAKPGDINVLVRGELGKAGELAPRGFLSAVKTETEHAVDPAASGRLQLAAWLTDPSNPLPARVAVNRIWHQLFGRGIVRTTDNFGNNGEPPTHPELLDYLAGRFIAEGWSTKRLIREIVTSRTYQLSSELEPKNYELDPDNTLLWRASPRRLDVESIRDAMLAASGQLNLSPPAASPVAEIGPGEVGRGIKREPLTRPFHHRSVYLPILRTDLLEILRVFDYPEPSIVVGARSVTTVPAQALFLMNSPFVIEQAEALAKRLLASPDMRDSARIELAYKRCLGRPATEAEAARSVKYLGRVREQLDAGATSDERLRLAWTSLCQALLASAEFRYTQ